VISNLSQDSAVTTKFVVRDVYYSRHQALLRTRTNTMRGSAKRPAGASRPIHLPSLGAVGGTTSSLPGEIKSTSLNASHPAFADPAGRAANGTAGCANSAAEDSPGSPSKAPARPVAPMAGDTIRGGSPIADFVVPLPPSRIPAAFHMRDEKTGKLIFPSERPDGDAEVGLLAETLGGMLEEWRDRLDQNKPTFPLGAARWGVLQMCIYDMWCTIEEARIWDIGLTETERFAHAYSPAMAAMLGRLRMRLAQAFSTVLSMSQRMQFELQRWHAAWLEQGEKLRSEEGQRQSLQFRLQQLQDRVTSLDEEMALYKAKASGDMTPLEKAFKHQQQESIRLSQQLRAISSKNTSMRAQFMSLKLSNEGLLDEVSKWRKADEENKGGSPQKAPSSAAPGSADTTPLLEMFASYSPEAQRIALDAILRVHEALTGEPAAATTAPTPPAVGDEPRVTQAAVLPSLPSRGVDPSERISALEQLADTLSEEESQALIRAVARRRANLASMAGDPPPAVEDGAMPIG